VLIAGASGVIGAAAVEGLARAGWNLLALSRRQLVVTADAPFDHVSLELTDAEACRSRLCRPARHQRASLCRGHNDDLASALIAGGSADGASYAELRTYGVRAEFKF
jgi:NAD(P)-dependent dehydrogenase (short-subunit alcohol dehydrogenase family)